MIFNMHSIINSEAYPIHRYNDPQTLQLIATAQSELTSTGACHFPQFLSPFGLSACLQEALTLESQAHVSNNQYTPYYREPDDTYPKGHPRTPPRAPQGPFLITFGLRLLTFCINLTTFGNIFGYFWSRLATLRC